MHDQSKVVLKKGIVHLFVTVHIGHVSYKKSRETSCKLQMYEKHRQCEVKSLIWGKIDMFKNTTAAELT